MQMQTPYEYGAMNDAQIDMILKFVHWAINDSKISNKNDANRLTAHTTRRPYENLSCYCAWYNLTYRLVLTLLVEER